MNDSMNDPTVNSPTTSSPTGDLAEPGPISRPMLYCPSCRSTHLDPVVEAVVAEVHFLCRDCGRCWHAELGTVTRVAPPTCLGCPRRGRCEEVYAADHADEASAGAAPGVAPAAVRSE